MKRTVIFISAAILATILSSASIYAQDSSQKVSDENRNKPSFRNRMN
jgi:hypothetical protein